MEDQDRNTPDAPEPSDVQPPSFEVTGAPDPRRQNAATNNRNERLQTPPKADRGVESEGVPVPSRIRDAMDHLRERVKEETDRGRDVVREYEERYYGSSRRLQDSATGAPDEAAASRPAYVTAKVKRAATPVTDNERKWAALAHGSTLLTALVALGSGGLGVLLTMLVPLFIYFSFRKRSEFVAFHALQAFTIQLIGTIGWLALVVVGALAWLALLVISALLILLLVGVILLPLVFVLGILFFVGSLALPLAMVIYSVIALVETWSGHDYRIPYISRWVESQMYTYTTTTA